MATRGPTDITGMLATWNAGDAYALDRLMDLVYPKVRRIARQQLVRRRAGENLESAALAKLANEAYPKLVRAGGIRSDNRVHFLALCSQIKRRILVDHARRRHFAKRGGGTLRVALDEVLDALARIDRRKCRVVELRYFGGLSIEETAAVLGVSVDTVKRDWRMAKAWLFGELTRAKSPGRAYGQRPAPQQPFTQREGVIHVRASPARFACQACSFSHSAISPL